MDKKLKYDPNAMNTGMFEIKIGQCENQEEYEELVRENQKLFAGWRDYISRSCGRKNSLRNQSRRDAEYQKHLLQHSAEKFLLSEKTSLCLQ